MNVCFLAFMHSKTMRYNIIKVEIIFDNNRNKFSFRKGSANPADSRYLFYKIHREKLYKNCVNKFLLTGSDSFPKLNMNNLCGSALSPHHKNVWKLFLFSNRVFLYNFWRASDGASFKKRIKVLSFSQVETFTKQKSFPSIFIIGTTVWFVHSKYGKNH